MEGRENARVKATRKRLADALMGMLREMPIHAVSIRELCIRAGINRTTFYKHFLDVYDLYDKLEQDILIEWGMQVLKMQDLRSKDFFIIGLVKNTD